MDSRHRAGKLTPNGETEPGNRQENDKNSPDPRSTQSQGSSPWQRPGLPSPEEQRAIAECLDAAGTYAYAVSKQWMQCWQRYIGLCHHPPSESYPDGVVQPADDTAVTLPPGPVEMDCESDDHNVFVDEGLCRRLVRWYGLSPRHQLDRKNRFFEDRKLFEVCVLNSFSGIVEHETKVLNRFEEIGYVEFQLRRIYGLSVDDDKRVETRLWISEKALVPRFQLLLKRQKMLNDFLDRDKAYILALEQKNNETQFWPTGELGLPKGALSKYDHLLQESRVRSSTGEEWHGEVEQHLDSSVKDFVGRVGRAFAEDGEKQLQKQRQCLEEVETEVKAKEVQILLRTKAVDARLKELSRRRGEIESHQVHTQSRSKQLEEVREKFKVEQDFMDRLIHSQNSRIVLDVGGEIFHTSRTTMKKDPKSLLAAMLADSDGLVAEDDGSFFIDRDGSQFRFILEFLRDETSIENLSLEGASLRSLLREAQFYQLIQLVDRLKELPNADKIGP